MDLQPDILEDASLLQNADDCPLQKPKQAKVSRRFLVVEGIYLNTGRMCPLREMMELKEKFKLRLFIDESISFGTLGSSGKGITEHLDVPVRLVVGLMNCREPLRWMAH